MADGEENPAVKAMRDGKKRRMDAKVSEDRSNTERLSGPSKKELQDTISEKDKKIQELEKQLQVSDAFEF